MNKWKTLIRKFDFFGFGEDDDESRLDGGKGKGNNGNGNGNGNGRGPQNRQNLFIMLVVALVMLLCISYFMRGVSESAEEITYSQFMTMVEQDQVARVEMDNDRISIAPRVTGVKDDDAQIRYYTGIVQDDTLTQKLLDKGVVVSADVPDSTNAIIAAVVSYVLPILLMWVLLSFLFRRMSKGGMMGGVGKSNAKEYVQRETGITYKEVAGEDGAKESLQEVVDFLHNPGKYVKIGAKLPKGALLVGPPGTGKTMLS